MQMNEINKNQTNPPELPESQASPVTEKQQVTQTPAVPPEPSIPQASSAVAEQRAPLKLKNDYVFKAVFGADTPDSREMLRQLLNLVLGRESDPIREVTIRNPFIIDEDVNAKSSELDILAASESGEFIDVEMQVVFSRGYLNRTVYYVGKMIREQLEHGDDYDKMKKVISISFVDGIVFPNLHMLHTEFSFYERTAHHQMMEESPEIHFLQLHHLNLPEDVDSAHLEELSELEKLCCMIRYQGVTGYEPLIRKLVEQDRKGLIRMIAEKTDKIQQDERAYYQALAREKYQFIERYREQVEAEQAAKIADLEARNADQENKIVNLETELARYKKMLEENRNGQKL